MNKKVLFVDDEQNILDSLKRQLRKHFTVETALGPEKGLEMIKSNGPFAVIVSDLRMPVMDGIQFLAQAKTLAPDTVRIILTGNADLENAIHAVNEGNIYRFLTKPCATEILLMVLNQSISQYRLVTSEKELLEKTLRGSIKMLIDLLSMLNPEAFGRSSRIKRYAKQIASQMNMSSVWMVETAAMLSQIGCVILPDDTMKKLFSGEELTPDEQMVFESHPKVASDLLLNIPRLKKLSDIIINQDKTYNENEDIPLGARILKVVLDFDLLETKGFNKANALQQIKEDVDNYDPGVVNALEIVLGVEAKFTVKDVFVNELRNGMIFFEDVYTIDEKLLISRGQEVNEMITRRLRNYSTTSNVAIKEPIQVIAPLE